MSNLKNRYSETQTADAEPPLTIHIQMLGDFVLSYNGNTLSGETVRGKQIWNLLEYILANRKKEISMARLIDVLWEEDAIEDPANALKNLAYRLRTTLKKSLDLPRNDVIIFKQRAYIWNPQIACSIDVDSFEEFCQKGNERINSNEEEALTYFRRALPLYRGNFLPQSAEKDWIVPLSIYYQRLYMTAVERTCQILFKRYEYKEIEQICHNAIVIDPFIETNHSLLIQALIASNNQKKANQHYHAVHEMFRDELGIEPSEEITRLYEKVINEHNTFKKDIAAVKKDLQEAERTSSALCCTYEMFKTIYRLQARTILRTEQTVCIMLLTAKIHATRPTRKNWDKLMERAAAEITAALRKNDVVCRYGSSQFLSMLSESTYKDATVVVNRVLNLVNANEFLLLHKVSLHGQVTTVDPAQLIRSNKKDKNC